MLSRRRHAYRGSCLLLHGRIHTSSHVAPSVCGRDHGGLGSFERAGCHQGRGSCSITNSRLHSRWVQTRGGRGSLSPCCWSNLDAWLRHPSRDHSLRSWGASNNRSCAGGHCWRRRHVWNCWCCSRCGGSLHRRGLCPAVGFRHCLGLLHWNETVTG